jgi:hypothetical protein
MTDLRSLLIGLICFGILTNYVQLPNNVILLSIRLRSFPDKILIAKFVTGCYVSQVEFIRCVRYEDELFLDCDVRSATACQEDWTLSIKTHSDRQEFPSFPSRVRKSRCYS